MKRLLPILMVIFALLMPTTLWAQGLAGDETVEPYAVLSEDSTVLTFYYDDQKDVRGGMSVANRFGWPDYQPWHSKAESITTAEFDPSFASCTTLTSTAYWFYECSNLTSITGIQYLKTDNVTDMGSMFYGCSGLTSLDVTNFKTDSVINMRGMFEGCSGLMSLDLSNFNTANVTDMPGMFYECSSLTSLDVSGFKTDNVTNMRGMFDGCSGLTSLDLSNFKTDNVTNMGSMFWKCSGLTSLDLSGFKTDNVTDMSWMFSGCSGLTSLDVSGFKTDNVTNMYYMFHGCSGLTSLDLSGFKTDNVTDMSWMFSDCSGLTSLDLSGFKTDNVADMDFMFSNCSGLTSLDLSGFKTDNVADMEFMFLNCSGLTSLDVSGFKTDNVTNMEAIFSGCSGLTSLDVSGFNTDNVMNMSGMFHGCSGLTSLDVSGFKTDNVKYMSMMFYSCSGLTSLDVSGFRTDNVKYMSSMFDGCSGLTSLDLSGFKTDNVTNMSSMFEGCSGLTSLDVSHMNTANVTDMHDMFHGCSGLTSLDLSIFNTAKVADMRWMFYGCSGLTTIYVGSGWSTKIVEEGSGMFLGCTSLVGGAGTKFSENHIDVAYAHIDGGTDNPGYFTLNLERVKNGKVEDDDYSSFALSFNLQVQDLTQENIVEDSDHPGNKCIKVVSLENPEDITHSQFMIRIGEPMKTGQKYKFSMDYKASKEAPVTSQVHTEPGEYLHWNAIGSFTATPEWQTYETEGEVSDDINGFKTIVFNLSNEKSSTEFYFDNISFKVDAVEAEVPDTVETPTFEFEYIWDNYLTIKTETEDAEIYYTMNGRMLEREDANFGYNTLGRYGNWKAWGDNLQEAKSEYNEDVYSGYYGSNYVLKLTSRVDSVMESAQLGYRFNTALTKNDYYTVHFQARSVSGNGQIQFFCQNDTLTTKYRSAADTMAIGKEWADYEYTVKIDNDSTNQIVLNFGGVADTYYIDNVLFGPVISDTINGNLRTHYENPIEMRDNVTITAVAVKDGMAESKTAIYDYFYEGWIMLRDTYEKCRMALQECYGDPNVPLQDVDAMSMRLGDMLYSYYERRTEKRFDDNELLYAAEDMLERVDMIYQMKQGFVIDGVAYHAVDSTQVEVRKPLGYYSNGYKGAIAIAPEVFFNNINFRVTSVTEDAFANSELGAIVWNPEFTVPDNVNTMVNNPNLLVYVNSDALAPKNITNVVINGVAKNIILVDATTENGSFLVPESFTAEQISYERTFNQETMVGVCRGWESIALPFDVQTITHEKQGAISPFGRGDSNKHFWLRRLGSNGFVQADKIEANVPYIIAMPNSSEYSEQYNLPGRVTFSATNAIVPITEERVLSLSDSTIMMIPTMQRLGRSSRYYAINVGEVRGQYLEGSVFERDYREIRPFEAYTTHAENAPAPRFVPIDDIIGGNMTGIEDVRSQMSDGRSDIWYDLNGRRLQKEPAQKGVYLRNGRKVIIR